MEEQKKRKRKKPKNHIADAKFYSKKGIYGRGSNIEESQYSYFINILETIENGFETAEDKVNMANNVLEQMEKQEVHLASNQVVSRVVENLIGFVRFDILERFFTAFSDDFRPICSHPFASHVLEKIVEVAFLRTIGKIIKAKDIKSEIDSVKRPTQKKIKPKQELISDEIFNTETSEFSEEHRTKCSEFLKRVGKFLLNNLEDFVWDSCANHIMRTCILLLGGVHEPKITNDKSKTNVKKDCKYYVVPDDWSEIMLEFPNRLQMWPQFPDLPYQQHSSPLLGCICLSMKNSSKKQLKHFGSQILHRSFIMRNDGAENEEKAKDLNISQTVPEDTQNSLPNVFKFECSVILLEKLISVAGPKLLTQIYAMLFAGRIELLSKDELTNKSVAKLLQSIREKDDFENIFMELVDVLEEILRIGHTRVVETLTQACLRLQCKQSQMISALQKALHTTGGGDKQRTMAFFQCLVKLKPYEIVMEKNDHFVHFDGCLIVEHILNFAKPIYLVNSILETSADVLQSILETTNGSYIANAFMYSSHVGEKSREKLIRLMEGRYIDLAITKMGSRVIDVFVDVASEPLKKNIIKELFERKNLLNSNFYGRVLYQKFRLENSNKAA